MWAFLYRIGMIVPRAMAQLGPPPGSGNGIQISNPLGCSDWAACIKSVLGGLALLATPVVGIMILVGGYQIMASGGNEEKLRKGKNTIIYAVVGYAVILLASGVAAVIQSVVSNAGS